MAGLTVSCKDFLPAILGSVAARMLKRLLMVREDRERYSE